MLQTFLLTMRGTPYFFQGEEIGMTNVNFNSIEEYRDVNTLNRYEFVRKSGGDLEQFLENEKPVARDNVRTPMQWDNSTHAGFTSGQPWIGLNPNYNKGINVQAQEEDTESVLQYFRRMVDLRKTHLPLVYGNYQLQLEENEEVYAYTRTLGEESFLILLSFSTESTLAVIDELSCKELRLMISNMPDQAEVVKTDLRFEIRPYQSLVYKLIK